MPDCSAATRASVVAAARDLTGSVITNVTYYGFSFENEDWDCGQYHQATMGVELACSDGRQYVACWGDAFGHFGLELVAGAADDIFLLPRAATSHGTRGGCRSRGLPCRHGLS